MWSVTVTLVFWVLLFSLNAFPVQTLARVGRVPPRIRPFREFRRTGPQGGAVLPRSGRLYRGRLGLAGAGGGRGAFRAERGDGGCVSGERFPKGDACPLRRVAEAAPGSR